MENVKNNFQKNNQNNNEDYLLKLNVPRIFVVFILVMGVFMCLLDTTIVDITIPHMMSALGADYDSIQWVVISYMVSSAVAMPLAPWVAKKIGLKNTYILGLILFTVMSALCGLAPNLELMLVARTFQGFAEGLLVPTALSILYNIYPPDQKGVAAGTFAIGAVTGPALGPTLGGYINEHLNWRWIFYINVPVGILASYLTYLFIDEIRKKVKEKLSFDFIGALTFSISISAFLIALSKGNKWEWTSLKTLTFFLISYIFGILFFIWEILQIKKNKPVFINLKLFIEYPNFTLGTLSFMFFGMSTYAVFFVLPLLLEKLLKFPTLTAGEILFYPALASGVGSSLAGILGDKYKLHREFLIISTIGVTIGTYMLTNITLESTKWQIVSLLLPWGFFMGMFFTNLTPISLATFHGENLKEPNAIQNLIRLVGGSIGTAVATTYFTRMHIHHFRYLNEFVDPSKSIYNHLYFKMKMLFGALATKLSKVALYFEINKKAYLFSFWDVFILSAFFAAITFILVLILAYVTRNLEVKSSVGGE